MGKLVLLKGESDRFQGSGQEPGAGRGPPRRPFGAFFSWLEDERPGFPGRGRRLVWEEGHEQRLQGKSVQVTGDRKATGQRPGKMRSRQTQRDRVRALSTSESRRTRSDQRCRESLLRVGREQREALGLIRKEGPICCLDETRDRFAWTQKWSLV